MKQVVNTEAPKIRRYRVFNCLGYGESVHMQDQWKALLADGWIPYREGLSMIMLYKDFCKDDPGGMERPND